jgi:hypothetical protein
MPGSFKWSLTLRFPHQNPAYTSPLPHTCYMPHPPHSSQFDLPKSTGWGVQIINLLIMQCSPFPCYLVPLRSKYSPSTPYSQTPSVYIPPWMWVTKFHTHTKQQAKL